MSIIPKGLTIKEYYARDAQRKARRKQVQKFNAKMKGTKAGPSKTTLIAQLDHLFSLLIRRRDRLVLAGLCLVCRIKPIEVCYHLTPRGAHSTRWHEDNAVGACCSCNWGEKNNRIKYRHKHVELFGVTRIERMEALARQHSHFTTADLIAMRDGLKIKLEGGKV